MQNRTFEDFKNSFGDDASIVDIDKFAPLFGENLDALTDKEKMLTLAAYIVAMSIVPFGMVTEVAGQAVMLSAGFAYKEDAKDAVISMARNYCEKISKGEKGFAIAVRINRAGEKCDKHFN